jgi:hypothetical protein
MYKIEKNVPIVEYAGGGRRKYPYKDMVVGDSVLLPSTKASHLFQLAANAWLKKHRSDVKIVRCQDRVWMVATKPRAKTPTRRAKT